MTASYPLHLISITSLPGYKVWAVFSDKTEGAADLSWVLEHPELKKLKDPDFFATVHLGPGGCLVWEGDLEIGWEGIYTEITGKDWDEVFAPREQSEFIELVRASITKPPDAFVEFSDGTSGEIRLPKFELDTTAKSIIHKPPDEIAINSWGNIIWNGSEFDGDAMYFALTGVDINAACELSAN